MIPKNKLEVKYPSLRKDYSSFPIDTQLIYTIKRRKPSLLALSSLLGWGMAAAGPTAHSLLPPKHSDTHVHMDEKVASVDAADGVTCQFLWHR